MPSPPWKITRVLSGGRGRTYQFWDAAGRACGTYTTPPHMSQEEANAHATLIVEAISAHAGEPGGPAPRQQEEQG